MNRIIDYSHTVKQEPKINSIFSKKQPLSLISLIAPYLLVGRHSQKSQKYDSCLKKI